MKFEIRWPTSLIDVAATKPGDLLLVGHGDNELLVLAVGTEERKVGLIMTEFGVASGFPIPEMVAFNQLASNVGETVRRFDAGLVFEPLARDLKGAAPTSVQENPRLGLAEIVGGERALYARCRGLNGWGVFDLASGAPLDLKQPPLVRPFRLRWRDGDDFIEIMSSADVKPLSQQAA